MRGCRSGTEGLGTVIFGVPMQPGDEAVVSEWDYPSALGGWQQRASHEGIRVVRVSFDPLDDDDVIVSAYASALTARTRVMQLTHMLHWTGRVLPAERLCELARDGVSCLWSVVRRPSRKCLSACERSAATSSSPACTSGWVLPLETAC
jgi:selenocysteine lyase/cysteine desulfurase